MNFELIPITDKNLYNPELNKFNYYVNIIGSRTFDEVYEWMIDNIGEHPKDWYCEVEHVQVADNNGGINEFDDIYFWFKEEHAMAFKLRWT